MTLIIVLAVIAVLAVMAISIYNNLVTLRNNRENAFANIDVQLQQRYDLIPNLVSTVKGYATHESETLQKITNARAAEMNATSINDKIAAENQLTSALANLKVSVEAYPELKANQNFMHLQQQLTQIESEIERSRRYYNGTVREQNNRVEQVPSCIVANMCGFKKMPFFQVEESDRQNVDVAAAFGV